MREKTVGDITIERQHPFDSGRQLPRTYGQQDTHVDARPRIRRDSFPKPGDKIDPRRIRATSACLLRAPYIPSDVDITDASDSLDSTRVNMVICTVTV